MNRLKTLAAGALLALAAGTVGYLAAPSAASAGKPATAASPSYTPAQPGGAVPPSGYNPGSDGRYSGRNGRSLVTLPPTVQGTHTPPAQPPATTPTHPTSPICK
jgi:hypothetical protein